MQQITMNVGGMSCGHCVAAVTRALESVDGVRVEQVGVGKATVSYDPDVTSPARIAEALEGEGYAAAPAGRP
jgi:copper chaperone